MNNRVQGLTLIELLSAITIFSILAATALPSFSKQIANHQNRIAADDLLQAISLARQYAVTTNQRVTMAATNGWNNGWEVFMDKNSDGIRSPNEQLISARQDPFSITITGNQPVKKYISFVGTGESQLLSGAFQAGTLTLCNKENSAGYAIIIRTGGRARLERTDCTNT